MYVLNKDKSTGGGLVNGYLLSLVTQKSSNKMNNIAAFCFTR